MGDVWMVDKIASSHAVRDCSQGFEVRIRDTYDHTFTAAMNSASKWLAVKSFAFIYMCR